MTKKTIQPEASLQKAGSRPKVAYTMGQAFLAYRKQRMDEMEKAGFEFVDKPKTDKYELTVGMIKEAAHTISPKSIPSPGSKIIIARVKLRPDAEETADKSEIN
jgi:hypothetical protein